MAVRPLGNPDLHHWLERSRGTVVVMFTAAGCGACRRMRAALAACPEIEVVEVDAGVDAALANEFEVFHLPALFVYRDGRYLGPLAAEPLPERLREALAARLAAPPQEPP